MTHDACHDAHDKDPGLGGLGESCERARSGPAQVGVGPSASADKHPQIPDPKLDDMDLDLTSNLGLTIVEVGISDHGQFLESAARIEEDLQASLRQQSIPDGDDVSVVTRDRDHLPGHVSGSVSAMQLQGNGNPNGPGPVGPSGGGNGDGSQGTGTEMGLPPTSGRSLSPMPPSKAAGAAPSKPPAPLVAQEQIYVPGSKPHTPNAVGEAHLRRLTFYAQRLNKSLPRDEYGLLSGFWAPGYVIARGKLFTRYDPLATQAHSSHDSAQSQGPSDGLHSPGGLRRSALAGTGTGTGTGSTSVDVMGEKIEVNSITSEAPPTPPLVLSAVPPQEAWIPIDYDEGFPTVDGSPIWYILPTEPTKYYKLFKLYLRMVRIPGATPAQRREQPQDIHDHLGATYHGRSLKILLATAELQKLIPNCTLTRLHTIFHIFLWADRAAAYDNYLAGEVAYQRATEVELLNTRHKRYARKAFETASKELLERVEDLDDNVLATVVKHAVELERTAVGLSRDGGSSRAGPAVVVNNSTTSVALPVGAAQARAGHPTSSAAAARRGHGGSGQGAAGSGAGGSQYASGLARRGPVGGMVGVVRDRGAAAGGARDSAEGSMAPGPGGEMGRLLAALANPETAALLQDLILSTQTAPEYSRISHLQAGQASQAGHVAGPGEPTEPDEDEVGEPTEPPPHTDPEIFPPDVRFSRVANSR
jgi:hypothetical protein